MKGIEAWENEGGAPTCDVDGPTEHQRRVWERMRRAMIAPGGITLSDWEPPPSAHEFVLVRMTGTLHGLASMCMSSMEALDIAIRGGVADVVSEEEAKKL